MRGYQRKPSDAAAISTQVEPGLPAQASADGDDEMVELLLNIRDELRRTRELLEQRGGPPSPNV
jgi:hypothetical protein